VEKKGKYYKKLYSACGYMIEHSKEYRDEPACRLINEVLTRKVKRKGKNNNYETPTKDECTMNLHNRLLVAYEILIGKVEKPEKDNTTKGVQVYPDVDFTGVSEATLVDMLLLVYRFMFKENDVSEIKRKKLRQELFSVNVDKDKPILSYLADTINGRKIEDLLQLSKDSGTDENESVDENNDVRESIDILDRVFTAYKSAMIWNIHGDTTLLQQYYDILIKNVPCDALKMMSEKYPQLGELKELYFAWLYIDLCCRYILHKLIDYLKDTKIHIQVKRNKVDELNEIAKKMCMEFSRNKIMLAENAEFKMEKELFQILAFYYIRDKFLMDTAILKYITQNCGERTNPDEMYSLLTVWKPYKLNMYGIQKIFAEDVDVKRTTFSEQYSNLKKGIDLFNWKVNRGIQQDLISQKAFYREIYLDKTKYNRKTSKHIFNQFLKTGKMNTVDYYFIDEKINMGMFREYGLIEEFWLKNEFQDNLYYLVALALAQLKPLEMANSFKRAIERIVLELNK